MWFPFYKYLHSELICLLWVSGASGTKLNLTGPWAWGPHPAFHYRPHRNCSLVCVIPRLHPFLLFPEVPYFLVFAGACTCEYTFVWPHKHMCVQVAARGQPWGLVLKSHHLFGGFSFVVVVSFCFTRIWHERMSMYVHEGGGGLHMCAHACRGPRLTSDVFPYLPQPYVVCSKPKATGSCRLQNYSGSSSSYPTTPSSYLPQVAIFVSWMQIQGTAGNITFWFPTLSSWKGTVIYTVLTTFLPT